MYISGASSCCGLGELENVAGFQNVKQLENAVNTKDFGGIYATTIKSPGGSTSYFTVQNKLYEVREKWLKELGFKLVSTFYNPNSGNTVKMWVKVLMTKLSFKCSECDKKILKKTYNKYDSLCFACFKKESNY